MMFVSANLPKFSPTTVLRYMAFCACRPSFLMLDHIFNLLIIINYLCSYTKTHYVKLLKFQPATVIILYIVRNICICSCTIEKGRETLLMCEYMQQLICSMYVKESGRMLPISNMHVNTIHHFGENLA